MSNQTYYKTKIYHMPELYYDLPFYGCYDLAKRLIPIVEKNMPSKETMIKNGYTSISYLVRCAGVLSVLELAWSTKEELCVRDIELPALSHWVNKNIDYQMSERSSKIEALTEAVKKVTDLGFPYYQPRPILDWEKDLLLVDKLNFI